MKTCRSSFLCVCGGVLLSQGQRQALCPVSLPSCVGAWISTGHLDSRWQGMPCTVSDQPQMAVLTADRKQGPSLRFSWVMCHHVPIKPVHWCTRQCRHTQAVRLPRLGARLKLLLGTVLYVDTTPYSLQALLHFPQQPFFWPSYCSSE